MINYNTHIQQLKSSCYDPCGLKISAITIEKESQEYGACNFTVNGQPVICRNAKTTPKKAGQFVTFWKRNNDGPIAPFNETDAIAFFVINVKTATNCGQFVFPKATLLKNNIISTPKKEGKRGFRIYAPWDTTTNKQAQQTQKWQLNYFFEINDSIDFEKVLKLYTK